MEKKQDNKIIKKAIIIFIVLLVIDQITKLFAYYMNINIEVIHNVLNFELVLNRGGVFGIGQGGNPIMFIIPDLIVLGIIIRFIYLQKERIDKSTMYALFIVLSGGFGNLIDRITTGAVIDFFRVFPSSNFLVFNLSDIYIVVGWVVLAFVFAKYSYEEIRNRKKIGK